MVFEKIFSVEKLRKSFWYSAFVGVICSIIGIFIARFLFGANSGLASVMFTSILLIPILKELFKKQEELEFLEKTISLKKIFLDNKQIIKSYSAIFVGIFSAYYLVSYLGVLLGLNVISVLREQLFMDAALIGHANTSSSMFLGILSNNWLVIIACFLLSIAAGSGGALFVVWNISTWAAIFGYRAAAASYVLQVNPIVSASVIQAITLPHTIIEALAYIVASLAGAIISTYVISSKKNLTIFIVSFIGILVLFFGLSYILKGVLSGFMLTLVLMVLFICLIGLLRFVFNNDKHKMIFEYNYYLFIGALLIFIVGALVESYVLSNSNVLDKYYSAAYIYATLK